MVAEAVKGASSNLCVARRLWEKVMSWLVVHEILELKLLKIIVGQQSTGEVWSDPFIHYGTCCSLEVQCRVYVVFIISFRMIVGS